MATRWGIVATGMIANDFCRALQLLPSSEHEVVAVAEEFAAGKAKEFAERFSIARHYDSYEELAREAAVDVVYVASVNTCHKEQCLLMMRHGKHVLCEKPMTVNAKEQKAMLHAARESGVFFMEAIWSRFFPAYARIRDEIQSGSIGEVRIVQATLCMYGKEVPRIRAPELGGGALLDIGIYPIQLALMAFGGERPEKVVASGFLMDTGVDECTSITLLFKYGRMAVLTVSIGTDKWTGAAVIGTKGTLELPGPFWAPTRLVTPQGTLDFPVPGHPSAFTFPNAAGLSYEATAVRQCLLAGKTQCDLVSHRDSETIMAILDEVRRQLGYRLPHDD